MVNLLHKQYELIKESREVIFRFLQEEVKDKINFPLDTFNGKTIAYLYLHIANTYISWAGNFALKGADAYYDQDKPVSLTALNNIFIQIDEIMNRFTDHFVAQHLTQAVEGFKWPDKYIETDAYSIFTHVITHEFHHKGQAMTMARLLGHLPPDADVMRF